MSVEQTRTIVLKADWAQVRAVLLASYAFGAYGTEKEKALAPAIEAELREAHLRGYEQGRLDALTEVLRSAGLLGEP